MITIKEIADMLDVSTTTVSNVIHGKMNKVSKENIERIQKALKETNYVQRMGLSALTNSSSRIIGVVIYAPGYYENTIVFEPFYSQIIGILEKKIREAGYYMMLYAGVDMDDVFRMSLAWNVDGLIAVSFKEKDYSKLKALTNKPVVGIDCLLVQDQNIFNIGLNDLDGGYQMTKYLINNGFRNILFVAHSSFQPGMDIDGLRWKGYVEALSEFSIPYKKEHLVILDEQPNKRINTYRGLMRFMKKDYAMFFASDYSAVEAMGFFLDNKVLIPDDISIVGFDDNIYARISAPKLTTVHQDTFKKGELAVEMILKLLNNELFEPQNVLLPITLAIRSSVKPINKS